MSGLRAAMWLLSMLLASSIVHGDARQLGTRTADAWIATLENPNRIAGLKIDEVVARLGLRPGNIVADIGAGAGAFEGALSAAVTPEERYMRSTSNRACSITSRHARKTSGYRTFAIVLGRYTDPALPSRNVDTALIYDVLHHIKDRETYLKNLAGYLAPGGRIAVVDFIPGKGGHANDAEQQVTRQQADAWMAAAGLKPVEEIALFDDKWFAIYAK